MAGAKEVANKGATYSTGKDMLLLPDGSTYHLGTKKGDLYNRIVTVGSKSRAKALSTLLDSNTPVKELHSSRDFCVYSGMFSGVGVSIISIGMGAPMMDFMMREATYSTEGPLAVIRLGTCGLFNKDLKPGCVPTAGKGSMYVYTNYAHFNGCFNDPTIDDKSPAFLISKPTPCDKTLNDLLMKHLKIQNVPTHDGINACGETFYSCQGRKDDNFDDHNNTVIVDQLLSAGVDFVEMETHQLFHLAQQRREPCFAAACAIGIVQRTNTKVTDNIDADRLHELEKEAGRACLGALVEFKL